MLGVFSVYLCDFVVKQNACRGSAFAVGGSSIRSPNAGLATYDNQVVSCAWSRAIRRNGMGM